MKTSGNRPVFMYLPSLRELRGTGQALAALPDGPAWSDGRWPVLKFGGVWLCMRRNGSIGFPLAEASAIAVGGEQIVRGGGPLD